MAFIGPLVTASITAVYVARKLGPATYGRYVFLVFVYTAGSALAIRGLVAAAVRYVSFERGRARLDEGTAVAGYTLANAAAGGLIVGSAIVLGALVVGRSIVEFGL